MASVAAYGNIFVKKIRKLLRSETVCKINFCNSKSPYYYIVHVRNILLFFVLIFLIGIHRGMKFHDAQFARITPIHSLNYLKFKERNYKPKSIKEIKQLISEYNTNGTILNNCSFEDVKRNSIIIVIQVRSLTYSLKHLIVSLSRVRGIDEVLLIFSHARYDINFNRFIRNIDFCRIQQIFYPYSLQVNPTTFPGFDPNDCPYNMDTKKALEKNCTGALTPDVRGFFRDPEKAEKKHHWWWTANKVFEDLKFSNIHERMVIFLEEDMYLMEDFLYMAIYMKGITSIRHLPHCEFISLATPTSNQFKNDEDWALKVEVTHWNPVTHSNAIAFNINTWNKIVGHYDLFCNVDDFSWSKSIFHLSKRISNGKERFNVMSSVLPRAYKIRHTGFFESFNRRVIFENAYAVIELQRSLQEELFPGTVKIYVTNDTQSDIDLKSDILSGGWSDPRDIKLCLNMTVRKIKKVFFEMATQFE